MPSTISLKCRPRCAEIRTRPIEEALQDLGARLLVAEARHPGVFLAHVLVVALEALGGTAEDGQVDVDEQLRVRARFQRGGRVVRMYSRGTHPQDRAACCRRDSEQRWLAVLAVGWRQPVGAQATGCGSRLGAAVLSMNATTA